MPYKPKELEQILQSKFAFELVKKSPDHRWYELRFPGLPHILTMISHSRTKEYGPALESKIAQQLRVSNPYFDKMMGCSVDRLRYQRDAEEWLREWASTGCDGPTPDRIR